MTYLSSPFCKTFISSYTYDMHNIYKVTDIDEHKRSTLFRRLASLPLENQLQVFKQCINLQHKHKIKFESLTNAQALLVSFSEAIYDFTEIEINARDNLKLYCEKSRKREKIQVQQIKKRHKRKAVVRTTLLKAQNWTLIKKLRIVDKMTYPEIADYLRTYHKVKVESSYLCKLWKEKEGTGD